MAATFQCTLITPMQQVLDEPITGAIIPAWDGEMGLLHNHAPILVKLGDGKLKIETGKGDKWYFVAGGFAQWKDNKLTLLTKEAVPAEEIKRETADAMLKEAEARNAVSAADFEKKNRDLKRARVYGELASTSR